MLKVSRFSDGINEVSSILTEKELKQLHAALDRLLTKLKQYDPATDTDRIFSSERHPEKMVSFLP